MDITKFRILQDNVLVEALDIKEKDGIIKPSSYEDKPELGIVRSVGKGRMLDNGTIISIDVKVGDTVLFNRYSATKYNLDGNDFFIVREEDIVAVK